MTKEKIRKIIVEYLNSEYIDHNDRSSHVYIFDETELDGVCLDGYFDFENLIDIIHKETMPWHSKLLVHIRKFLAR